VKRVLWVVIWGMACGVWFGAVKISGSLFYARAGIKAT